MSQLNPDCDQCGVNKQITGYCECNYSQSDWPVGGPIDRSPVYTTDRVDAEFGRLDLPLLLPPPNPPPAPSNDVPVFMSTDSAVRKLMPITSGVLKYFPDALLLVAWVSRAGNDKHNPGQPLHWAKEKSQDESDCEVRHMLDYLRGEPADPGLEPLGELGHLASKAWRALAHLQRECDRVRGSR